MDYHNQRRDLRDTSARRAPGRRSEASRRIRQWASAARPATAYYLLPVYNGC